MKALRRYEEEVVLHSLQLRQQTVALVGSVVDASVLFYHLSPDVIGDLTETPFSSWDSQRRAIFTITSYDHLEHYGRPVGQDRTVWKLPRSDRDPIPARLKICGHISRTGSRNTCRSDDQS